MQGLQGSTPGVGQLKMQTPMGTEGKLRFITSTDGTVIIFAEAKDGSQKAVFGEETFVFLAQNLRKSKQEIMNKNGDIYFYNNKPLLYTVNTGKRIPIQSSEPGYSGEFPIVATVDTVPGSIAPF